MNSVKSLKDLEFELESLQALQAHYITRLHEVSQDITTLTPYVLIARKQNEAVARHSHSQANPEAEPVPSSEMLDALNPVLRSRGSTESNART